MGKTVKKNQQSRNVRGVRGGRYIVRGKTFATEDANSVSIASEMASNGYRPGATARWNGGEYELVADHFGAFSLKRIA